MFMTSSPAPHLLAATRLTTTVAQSFTPAVAGNVLQLGQGSSIVLASAGFTSNGSYHHTPPAFANINNGLLGYGSMANVPTGHGLAATGPAHHVPIGLASRVLSVAGTVHHSPSPAGITGNALQAYASVSTPATVNGTIVGKFEHGYFVTVKFGSQNLHGVLYHVLQVPPSLAAASSSSTTRSNVAVPCTNCNKQARRQRRKLRDMEARRMIREKLDKLNEEDRKEKQGKA